MSPPPPAPISLLPLMRSPARLVPITLLLVLVNAMLFLGMAVNSSNLWKSASGVPMAWGANFGPATQNGEWWRLLSAVFVHFSLVHLVVNMWALWDVGRLMERLLGRWRYLLLYLGAGIAGNLLSLAAHGSLRVSGGASGAIFGLYGALVVFLWRQRRSIDPDEYRWMFGGAIVFSALMLVLGYFFPGIDNAAHGGGLLAGAVLGALLQRPDPAATHPAAPLPKAWAAALGVAALATVFASLSPPLYRYEEELQARAAIEKFKSEDQAIQTRWQSLMRPSRDGSFNDVANALDREVAASYQRSFEELARVEASPAVPSHNTLLQLQSYATTRRAEAAQAAEALRHGHSPSAMHKGEASTTTAPIGIP